MSVLDTLKTVRAKYGASPTHDECGAIINETAWIHRSEGLGLSFKAGGTHATRHDGTPIATDVLMYPSGDAYDVLRAAGDGGPAEPVWQGIGTITDPSRHWVAPIEPKGGPVVPPPQDGTFEKEVVSRLDALGDQVYELGVEIAKLKAALIATGQRSYKGEAKILGMKTTFTLTPQQ